MMEKSKVRMENLEGAIASMDAHMYGGKRLRLTMDMVEWGSASLYSVWKTLSSVYKNNPHLVDEEDRETFQMSAEEIHKARDFRKTFRREIHLHLCECIERSAKAGFLIGPDKIADEIMDYVSDVMAEADNVPRDTWVTALKFREPSANGKHVTDFAEAQDR